MHLGAFSDAFVHRLRENSADLPRIWICGDAYRQRKPADHTQSGLFVVECAV